MAGLALAGTLSACTHTRALVLTPAPNATAPEPPTLNLDNREVTLALQNGFRIDADNLRFTGDGLAWRRAGTTEEHVTRAADIRQLSFCSHLRGALDGLLIGAAIGAPAGFLLNDTPTSGPGRGGATLSGAVSWATLSALIGAVKGSRIVYRVEPPAPTSNQQSPPSPPGINADRTRMGVNSWTPSSSQERRSRRDSSSVPGNIRRPPS
jgi:hypothetical protein